MTTKTKFRYFSAVAGRVVQRYGSTIFIGAARAPGGWQWDEDQIVAIPDREFARYAKEYIRAVRDGALKERTEAQYLEHVEQAAQPKTAEKKSDSKTKVEKKSGTKGDKK
jgi:hypothetical protein